MTQDNCTNHKRTSVALVCSFFLVSLLLAWTPRRFIVFAQDQSGQPAPGSPGSATVCAASDDAPKAFAEMVPTFQHPRCINCHGGINPFSGRGHAGGPQKPKLVSGPYGDEKVYDCTSCHVDGWDTPAGVFFFTKKNAVTLCKQMKDMGDADRFMGHISKDATTRTPFIRIGFLGTRGLNDYGEVISSEKTNKDYQPEPPPISYETFIAQAQAWIDAMGGKFRGDSDCGCVPHHYALVIDMQSFQDDSHPEVGMVAQSKVAGHGEIPLQFADDGSMTGEGQMTATSSGFLQMHPSRSSEVVCNSQGTMKFAYKLKGTVDDKTHQMNISMASALLGGSTTGTCNTGTNESHSLPASGFHQGPPGNISAYLDLVQDIPMPGQNPPRYTSSLKVKIIQKD